MAIPKTELNKRKREQRKALGLVKIEVWVRPEHKTQIRTIEKELNEGNHAAYDPIQLLETARTALADIGNAKDLTLEAAQRKAKRIYREIRQAMDGEENAT